ncbi:MAG TPA: pantetheine-phosphate adenylyltransferase [Bacteroidota bacterium]|nr:pantetheine-phosphate adenylyltransferase [Bacteroidota bacterium]
MNIAIYPGTFDPITNGHLDIIERAVKMFDKVIVTIARNSSKNPLFSDKERIKMIREAVKEWSQVEVDSFEGLLVDYARKRKASVILRGLRAISDFEYEFQLALTNRKLNDEVETVFLMPSEKYTYLNSTIVREIARLGGDVSDFVPPVVKTAFVLKFRK